MGVDVGCIELDLEKIKNLDFPHLLQFDSFEKSLKSNFDGYIIATPSKTHTEITKKVVLNDKPVLVEKPLSLSVNEAMDIRSLLAKRNGKLVVGHLLLFHPAFQKAKSLVEQGLVGKVKYMYSNRLNMGKVRADENVLWSYGPHDISLFQYFINSFPNTVTSFGKKILQKNIHDTVIVNLSYQNDIKGHIFNSWLHPFKEHRFVFDRIRRNHSF